MSFNESEIDLLRGLSDNLKKVFFQNASERLYESGEAIIWQGDECTAIYCILSGEIEIYRLSSRGREQMLDRMKTGACFNLVPALSGQGINAANVRALSGCRLLVMPVSRFQQILRENAEFNLAVSKYLANRLAHMAKLVETLSLYSVRQRLARFLIEQADTEKIDGSMRWTQTDMANRLGTVRDVLGRTLRKMEDEGLVRIVREKILLIDRQRLESVAEGNE